MNSLDEIKDDVQSAVAGKKEEVKYPEAGPYMFRTAPIPYATIESFANDMVEGLGLNILDSQVRALGKEGKENWIYTVESVDVLKYIMEELNNTDFPINETETTKLYFRVFEENRNRPGGSTMARGPRFSGLNRDASNGPKMESTSYVSDREPRERDTRPSYSSISRDRNDTSGGISRPATKFEFNAEAVVIEKTDSSKANDKFLEQLMKDEEERKKNAQEAAARKMNRENRDRRQNTHGDRRDRSENKPSGSGYKGFTRGDKTSGAH